MLGVEGEYVCRRQVGPGQHAGHLHGPGRRQGCVALAVRFDCPQHLGDNLLQILPVDQHGPREAGSLEAVASITIRQRDQVDRPTVFSLRAMPRELTLQHVPAVLRLAHRVNPIPHSLLALLPIPLVAANIPTLDLDHRPANTRQQNDEIRLVLMLPLLKPQAMEENRPVGQLVAQGLPDCPFRTTSIAKDRANRNEYRHTAVLPATARTRRSAADPAFQDPPEGEPRPYLSGSAQKLLDHDVEVVVAQALSIPIRDYPSRYFGSATQSHVIDAQQTGSAVRQIGCSHVQLELLDKG